MKISNLELIIPNDSLLMLFFLSKSIINELFKLLNFVMGNSSFPKK